MVKVWVVRPKIGFAVAPVPPPPEMVTVVAEVNPLPIAVSRRSVDAPVESMLAGVALLLTRVAPLPPTPVPLIEMSLPTLV